mmetsp:Transcript_61946/g.160881  ORF Transcript_61946/g.160881 Transcript_61946/m.160881 type:complete len:263 (-) Transcript_61946:75-863(-)
MVLLPLGRVLEQAGEGAAGHLEEPQGHVGADRLSAHGQHAQQLGLAEEAARAQQLPGAAARADKLRLAAHDDEHRGTAVALSVHRRPLAERLPLPHRRAAGRHELPDEVGGTGLEEGAGAEHLVGVEGHQGRLPAQHLRTLPGEGPRPGGLRRVQALRLAAVLRSRGGRSRQVRGRLRVAPRATPPSSVAAAWRAPCGLGRGGRQLAQPARVPRRGPRRAAPDRREVCAFWWLQEAPVLVAIQWATPCRHRPPGGPGLGPRA